MLVLELPAGATVGQLAGTLVQKYPRLPRNPAGLVVAVNYEYCGHDTRLMEGDEVALIPPVSGGFHD